ncbi:MAG: riboflavin kinase [Patescibacteria group bacterium]
MKFTSRVIVGQQHGRTIGYPTANLAVTDAAKQALGKEGVYAVKVRTKIGEYAGALFYGQRTLFKEEKIICEVLLINFTGDLYGEEVGIEIIKFLRPVQSVKDEEELKRLIEQDIANTIKLFNQ